MQDMSAKHRIALLCRVFAVWLNGVHLAPVDTSRIATVAVRVNVNHVLQPPVLSSALMALSVIQRTAVSYASVSSLVIARPHKYSSLVLRVQEMFALRTKNVNTIKRITLPCVVLPQVS